MSWWESYSVGFVDNARVFGRGGEPFTGTPEEFEKQHGILFGLRNIKNDIVIVLNMYGEIALRGKARKNKKVTTQARF